MSTSMTYLPTLLTSLVAAPLSYVAYKLFLFFHEQWTSPLRVLPGPPNPSLIFGNMKEISKAVRITRFFDSPSIHFIHLRYRRILSCTNNGSMNMGQPSHTRPCLE
jgi:hypothetical protein